MTRTSFDFSTVLRAGLPAPAQRWRGFPEYNFVGGNNDEPSVPVAGLIKAAEAVLAREGHSLGTYSLHSGPQGYLPLREFLCRKLKARAGMTVTPDDILLTSGSLQAMDLINQILLAPGDTVIIEESNYGGVLSRLNRLGVNAVTVPLDGEGMRIDALERVLDDLKSKGIAAKYIYCIPTVHNPTGTILTLDRRKALLVLANSHGVPVYEDECYADLVWSGERPPALAALDETESVIHIGSFSKSIAPALRVGYMVAPWAVLSQILSVKQDAGSGALEQMVLAEYCTTHFDDHLAGLNKTLKAKLDTMVSALDENFGTTIEFDAPPGGIFIWVRFPDAVETTRLTGVAAEAGIAVNPGREWSHGDDAGRHIRLCFASPSHDQIRAGVARLAEVCQAEFGVPERSANVSRA